MYVRTYLRNKDVCKYMCPCVHVYMCESVFYVCVYAHLIILFGIRPI